MSSKIERVARLAMSISNGHLSEYGAVRSRHDFTQRQLMACLILRAYMKTTYRAFIDFLSGHAALRHALGMEDKLPHHTTLVKFSARSNVAAIADAIIAKIGQLVLEKKAKGQKITAVAMDATGMESTSGSAHFISRAGRKRRRWVKLSLTVICGALLPLGLIASWGPTNDKVEAQALLEKSFECPRGALPKRLYGDAGYDADWIHALCINEWGIESVIKPARCRADGSLGGEYRSKMTPDRLKKKGYGKRWHIETFFSGLKRMTGSALISRSDDALLKEATFRVLAYTLHR